MKPTNSAAHAWALLSGTRLTTLCLGSLIALCLANEAARAWLESRGAFVNPEVGQWLRQWVVADINHAPGFKWVLALLFLNLVCVSFPAVRAALAGAGAEPASEGSENLLTSSLESKLGSDHFGELARRWARKNLGRASAVKMLPDGTRLLSVRYGQTSSWFKGVAHWAIVVAAVGAGLMLSRGFQVRVFVEEGAKIGAVEHVRGSVPASWKRLKPVRPGSDAVYFEPGFEIARAPSDAATPLGHSVLHVYREGQPKATLTLSSAHPAQFEDLTLHQLGYVPGSTQSVRLMVTDRATGSARRFAALGGNQTIEVEEFGFRVTEIRPETSDAGAAVEIEYREGEHTPERFWVFADFPNYDFAHRKKSAQHFTLEAVRPRTAAEIAIGREPGAHLLWGGLVLSALLFWIALARPEERFWIKWSEQAGAPLNIQVLGWSARPLSFSTRFYRLAGQLETHLAASESTGEARR